MTSQGIESDHRTTLRTLGETLNALLHGGPAVVNLKTGETANLPSAPTRKILNALEEQKKLLTELSASAETLLQTTPDRHSPEYLRQVKELTTLCDRTYDQSDQAVKLLDQHSKSAFSTLLILESATMVLLSLLGIALACRIILYAKVNKSLECEVEEHRKTEASLRRTEEKLRLFRSLIDQCNEAILVVDPETGCFLDVNDKACMNLGYSREELLNLTVMDIESVLPDPASWKKHVQEMKKSKVDLFEGEEKRKDGTRFPVEINVKYVSIGEDDYLVAGVREITERKAMEAQLRQSQKMEAIGRFAGGIAHDFNNLLTVMVGHSELLLLHQKPGSPEYDSIITIQETANRATQLTRQLLAFSRKQVFEPVVLDLNKAIQGMSRMFSRLMSEHVEQHLELDPAVRKIKADPSQIEQVILNLVVNAQDAMPDGGKLTISTEDRCLDEAYCRLHDGVMPGAYVLLSISDTGIGMTDQVREHIFEPFYTTKDEGKGTGLGLSMVYGIVQQMGGHIYVYSEVGHGTVFRIYLPAHHEADQEETPAASIESEEMPGGQETILVAEDDPSLLKLAVHILERLGYTVLSACDGEEALAKAIEYQERLDLLLTDVGLPGKKGFEVAEEIKGKYPMLKVLFMSGYADDRLAQAGAPNESRYFLPKPFTPSSMARKVREVLNS